MTAIEIIIFAVVVVIIAWVCWRLRIKQAERGDGWGGMG